MFRFLIFLAFATVLFSQSFGAEGARCGTLQFIDNSKNKMRKLLAKPGFENCVPENYYGRVDSAITRHFIIYYTQQRAHAISAKTPGYIDSLAKYLEQAYELHKNTLGMNGILGARRTHNYQKTVPLGLYPVEVIDTGLLRYEEGEYAATYGLTFSPNSRSPRATQIAIENDFYYGADCQGGSSTKPFVSGKNENYSADSDKWHWALKVTAFHELYHSFQMAQADINDSNSLWAEASATGVEEIGAPEVNDYISYLPNIFRCLGCSMGTNDKGYGHAVLYLFLYSELGSRFDSAIWNYFSKYPGTNFPLQLARLADSLHMDAEDLFHKYASHIFYSGARAKFSPSFWNDDMPEWPEWRIKRNALSVLPAAAIDFVIKTSEDAPRTDSVARISFMSYGDSSVWVLSRLLEKEFVAPPPKGELIAYPNPWNPKRYPAVRFKVPENVNKVEIRSANGALLERIRSDSENSFIWQPQKIPAPGILYYRSLPYGKNKVLIVEY
ncbi:MAG: hypothetical protein LBQ76_06525 [Candidatus Fibromonas sp.]|jgi:hypothetical protein|nr:hypothetical protein [Candidatus Fibromonas sp.]